MFKLYSQVHYAELGFEEHKFINYKMVPVMPRLKIKMNQYRFSQDHQTLLANPHMVQTKSTTELSVQQCYSTFWLSK